MDKQVVVKCQGAMDLSIDLLVPFQGDLKTLSNANYRRLRNDILELGFSEPISVWSDQKKFYILNGHQRLTTLQRMQKDGYVIPPIPVSLIEADSYDQAKKKVLSLTSQFGVMSAEGLQKFLADTDISFDDLQDFRFPELDMDEVKKVLTPEEEAAAQEERENTVPEADKLEVTVQAGDIYGFEPHYKCDVCGMVALGATVCCEQDMKKRYRHKLMCGDSTSKEAVALLMDGEQADMVLTDPPYNVDYQSSSGMKIENDSMGDEQFYEFLLGAYQNIEAFLKKGRPYYVFHADSEGLNFRRAAKDAGLLVKQCCIWVKPSLVMGRQDYQWRHEPCLYGWKAGESHTWYGERNKTTVWEFDKTKKNDVHPTMKPIELLCFPLNNSSKRGDLILELFGGSGSTLIASEKLGRRCYAMELDPKYCQVILNRYKDYSEGKAVEKLT